MKKLLMFTTLILWFFGSYGQNFSSDMARVNNLYIHLNKNMTVSTTTTVDKQVVSNQKISMSIKGVDEFYMKDAKTEVLVRDGLKIIVSRNDRAVIVDSNYQEELNQLPVSVFDTLQNAYRSIDRTILENGNIQYKLVPKTVNSRVLIILDSETLLIKLIRIESVLGNDKQQSLELKYSYQPLSELPSVSKYVVKTNGKYQLSQHWAGFTLLNYLPKPN